jgi:hypothetical protein
MTYIVSDKSIMKQLEKYIRIGIEQLAIQMLSVITQYGQFSVQCTYNLLN